MNGDLDGRTSIERAKEVANGFKNGKFITIKNASHNFWMVSPEIPDAMFAFLNGQPVEKSVIEDPLFEFRSPFEDELTEQLYSSTHADNLTFEKAYNDLLNGSKYLNSSVLANLANRLNRENKTDKAMMVLLFAVRQYPKNWRFHQALGEAYQRQGNNEMAKKSFETVLMLNPYGLRASQAINYK
jgi:tetratricopeptide (TPR) repeat protein